MKKLTSAYMKHQNAL